MQVSHTYIIDIKILFNFRPFQSKYEYAIRRTTPLSFFYFSGTDGKVAVFDLKITNYTEFLYD